jgi:hypothetical protein
MYFRYKLLDGSLRNIFRFVHKSVLFLASVVDANWALNVAVANEFKLSLPVEKNLVKADGTKISLLAVHSFFSLVYLMTQDENIFKKFIKLLKGAAWSFFHTYLCKENFHFRKNHRIPKKNPRKKKYMHTSQSTK